MVKIRYSLAGRKGQRIFYIVVIDSRKKRESKKKIEQLGYYFPKTKELSLSKERIIFWYKQGAQPTKSVRELLQRKNISLYL